MNRWHLVLAVALMGLPMAAPAAADLLICNVGTNSILRYDQAANTLSTFSNGDNGALKIPHGMTYGPDGNLYVSSLGTGSILEYNGTTGAFLGTLVPHAFGPSNTPQTLEYPNGIAFDSGHYLYISSYYNNEIDRYDTIARTLTTYATLPSSVSNNATSHLQGPTGLVIGSDGNLYVNDSKQGDGSQIRVYNIAANDTVGRSLIASTSSSITHLSSPAQLTFGPANGSNPPLLIDTSFFTGSYPNTVNSYQLTFQGGQYVATWLHQLAGISPGNLNEPGGVAYDPTTGRVIITNYLGNSLVSANLNGTSDVFTLTPTSIGGAALNQPTYIVPYAGGTGTPGGSGNTGGPGGPIPAPEPASLTLFGIGAMAWLGLRFRRARAR